MTLKQEKILNKLKEINSSYEYNVNNILNRKYNKLILNCPIHGEVEQTLDSFLKTKICKKCSIENRSKLYLNGQEDFINKAKIKHNNLYNYDKVKYIKSNIKIEIICKEHGSFFQTPNHHLSGQKCPKCFLDKKINNKEKFINYCNKYHKGKYNYSLVNYINAITKVKIICPIHGEFLQSPIVHQKSGCKKCSKNYLNKVKEKYKEKFLNKSNILHNNKYDYSLIDYKKSCEKVEIICPIHGKFLQTPNNHSHINPRGCPKCAFINSKFEKNIQKFLDFYNIKYDNNVRNLITKEIDIFIKDKNIGIECNGIYWHSENQGKDKNYHLNKLIECQNLNIRLIQILENEIINKPKIVFNRLKNILGLIKYKIYARKCEIKEIDNKLKNKFLEKYHIQGKDNSSIKLGLFYKNRLISIMTFCKLRKCLGQKNKENHYELSRFCCINNFSIVGGASKLLSYFEKQYKPKYIISYADRRWSIGNLYYKLGFKFSHNSCPNYWYFKTSNIKKIKHRFNFRKNILSKKLEKFDKNLTEWENMKNNGWNRIWDCGNMVFIKKYEET